MTQVIESWSGVQETIAPRIQYQPVRGAEESRREDLHFSHFRLSSDYVSLIVTASLARYFVSYLPKDSRIERVFWEFEGDILKIWTVINEPDYQLQPNIYRAELEFMAKFPGVQCDFTVVFRFNQAIDDIRPYGATAVVIES